MIKKIKYTLLSLIAMGSFLVLTSCVNKSNNPKTTTTDTGVIPTTTEVTPTTGTTPVVTTTDPVTTTEVEEVATTYTVNHYQENLDNDKYEIVSSQALPGISNHDTEAVAKTFDGFSAKPFSQVKINKDGSTVIDIYYERNRHEVKINDSNKGTSTGNGQYKYGQTVNVTTMPKTGYEFIGWYSNNNELSKLTEYSFVIENDVNLEARYKNQVIEYKVYYYQENVNNNEYTLVATDTETLFGDSFSQTQAQAKAYPGFTARSFSQEEINPDGSTVIRIYYDRLTRTVSLSNLNPSKGSVTGAGIYKYGENVTLTATPNEGYTVLGWFISNGKVCDDLQYSFEIRLENISIDVDFKPTVSEYKVYHYQQNIDNNEYTLVESDTETLSGDSFSQTQAEAKSYTGFTAKSFEQETIKPDKSTVINIYYDRVVKTVTVNNTYSDRGSFTGAGNYKYGKTVTLTASKNPGYELEGWYIGSDLKSDAGTYTFVIGVEDVTVELKFKYANANYTVKHYKENIIDSNYTLVESDTEILTGTSYSKTNAIAKSYTGFTAQTITQLDINPDGSTVVEIHYSRRRIQLSLNSNPQGKGSLTGIGTFKYGQTVNIKAIPISGYSFVKWTKSDGSTLSTNYSYNALIESTTNTLTYTANFTVNTYNININTQGISEDNIVIKNVSNSQIVTKDFAYGATYRLEVLYDGDDIVRITYNNSNPIFDARTYEFTMPDNTVTFDVTVSPIFKVDNKVYYGSYPQTQVTDSAIKAALNSILGTSRPTESSYSGWTANRLYKDSSQSSYKEYLFYKDVRYNSEKYRAVYFFKYKPTAHNTTPSTSTSSSYQDDNGFYINTVYWFKFESIKWSILDTDSSGNALILADLILDSREYYVNQTNSSHNHMVEGYSYGTGYGSDYAASTIRNWLSNQFFATAISSAQRNYYVITNIDHSASTLDGTSSNMYASATTSSSEAFFFISYGDISQYSDNFSLTTSGTDYSSCMGFKNDYYWLRSPSRYNSTEVTVVNSSSGSFNSITVTATCIGVRPACYVKLPN